MPLKLNVSNKGKAWKLEVEEDVLSGKSIGDKFDGKLINPDLASYELEITGGSDKSGFPMKGDVEGIGYKRVLLTKGWGLNKKSKGDKKKSKEVKKGMRIRKTVRGKTISDKSSQININVIKEGSKKLEEIFPDQNKAPEPEKKEETPQAETPAETPKNEAPKEAEEKKE